MRSDDRLSHQPSASEINDILSAAWTDAARLNPLLLAKLRPDYDMTRLKDMIQDCLARGLSALEARRHVTKELLHAAISNDQARSECDDNSRDNHTRTSA
ncbi:MAG TPA: hypothetical protein VFM05_11440 [Candidatus Saccharimonadales bacterium]|nr:hypothetical protein [Candidatus Saccharimonadales bacterium]